MSLALVIVATLALLAMLAARAAAAAPPAVPGDDATDLDTADVELFDTAGAELFDTAGEPHAPPPDLGASNGDASASNGDASASHGDANALHGDASALHGDATSGATPGSGAARELPPIHDVIAAAIRAAGLAGDPASGWRTRSRLAGLVPQLSARVGQDDTWRDVADPTLGHVITYGISASWRLDRLVYDPSELRIATVDVLRRRERRRLAWYVISLYRAWRRTHNEDLAAQLDVVTDGWFSERVLGRLGSQRRGR